MIGLFNKIVSSTTVDGVAITNVAFDINSVVLLSFKTINMCKI